MKGKLLKLFGLLSAYIALIFLLFSKVGLHLITFKNIIVTIMGIVVFILLTSVAGAIAVKILGKSSVTALETDEQKNLSARDKLQKHMQTLRSIRGTVSGPFNDVNHKIIDLGQRLAEKLDNIDYCLRESFSEYDLTYVTYSESLNNVLELFNQNLAAIEKRERVFDYREWQRGEGTNSSLSKVCIDEVNQLYEANDDIVDKMDSLLIELVQLDTITDAPLNEINKLIEQTQIYKISVDDE